MKRIFLFIICWQAFVGVFRELQLKALSLGLTLNDILANERYK